MFSDYWSQSSHHATKIWNSQLITEGHANLLKNELLQSAINKLETGSEPDLVVEELADKLTNKLLHTTFENIKKSPKISLEQSQDSMPVSKKPTNIHNSWINLSLQS